MSENKVDELEVLYGLETYCEFLENNDSRQFAHEMIKLLRSDNIKEAVFDYCLKNLVKENTSDPIFSGIRSYTNKFDSNEAVRDGLSRGQVRSKIWLIDELVKVNNRFDNVLIMAGWFGQLVSFYSKVLKFNKIRMIELDKDMCNSSDYIFNLKFLESHRVKSINADINNLILHKNGYEWDVENFKETTSYSEKFLPNLIINTSAEHMKEDWFFQIKFKQMESDPIVAVQSNNMFDGNGHINCVHSVDHMKKKFPMREIFYEGELQLKGYKRVMLIGKP